MGVKVTNEDMCLAMGRALGYGGACNTAKWVGLVSEQGLLLARVWIERSWVDWCLSKWYAGAGYNASREKADLESEMG